MKKKKGDYDTLFITLLSTLVLFIVLIGCLNYISTVNKYISANQIAREYILKIETKGYLTPDNIVKLETKLSDQGLTNIDLCDTTTNKVNNGDDVFLHLKYDQVIKQLKIENYRVSIVDEVKTIEIKRSSTAKN